MPRSLLLLAALLVLPLLASDAPKENGGAAAQSDGLEGTWEAVDSMGQMLTYRHGRFTISLNGDAKAGTYITDLRRTPRRLDEIPDPDAEGPRTWRMIYETQGDTLRVAYQSVGPNGERPNGFSDGGSRMMTWKRVKK